MAGLLLNTTQKIIEDIYEQTTSYFTIARESNIHSATLTALVEGRREASELEFENLTILWCRLNAGKVPIKQIEQL